MRLLGAAGTSENVFRVALKPQRRSKVLPEMHSVSLRSPKCSRKCCSGLLRSYLTFSNAARACSGAACALETAAWASSKAARSLEKLARGSSATALLSNSCADHLESGKGVKFKVPLEIFVRKGCSEIAIRKYCSKLLCEVTCLCNAVLTPTSRSSACKVHGMHGITLVDIYSKVSVSDSIWYKIDVEKVQNLEIKHGLPYMGAPSPYMGRPPCPYMFCVCVFFSSEFNGLQ